MVQLVWVESAEYFSWTETQYYRLFNRYNSLIKVASPYFMTFYEVSLASDWPHNMYNMHTYFDLISLPLSDLNFPHLSFFMQVWVFIQEFRHMQATGYSKFLYSGWQTWNIHYLLSGSRGTFRSKYVLLFLV